MNEAEFQQELAACRVLIAESRALADAIPRVFDSNMRPIGDPELLRAKLFDAMKRLKALEGVATGQVQRQVEAAEVDARERRCGFTCRGTMGEQQCTLRHGHEGIHR